MLDGFASEYWVKKMFPDTKLNDDGDGSAKLIESGADSCNQSTTLRFEVNY